jgi:GNAT superfamily N-acetyltransferase
MTAPAPTKVRDTDATNLRHATTIIETAMRPLAVTGELVPEKADQTRVLWAWFRILIGHAAGDAGEVLLIRRRAAAVWFDRTGEATEPEDYGKHLAAAAGTHVGRFQQLDKLLDDNHPREPHKHLAFLGVVPAWQRQGVGRQILEPTLAQFDKDNTSAYLEATSARAREFYSRLGFRDLDPDVIWFGKAPFHRMWRSVGG